MLGFQYTHCTKSSLTKPSCRKWNQFFYNKSRNCWVRFVYRSPKVDAYRIFRVLFSEGRKRNTICWFCRHIHKFFSNKEGKLRQICASKWINYPIVLISRQQIITIVIYKLFGRLVQVSLYGLLNINFFAASILC